MRPIKYLWALCLGQSGLANANSSTEEPENANHIFNGIQSTLRHYETAIKPYGLAFHLATVQKGTRFYHGTDKSDPIIGVEWLAFKPQKSLRYAHSSNWKGKRDTQQPLNVPTAGYLHTYAAAKDLRLLYIDGHSAGLGGDMQSQDRILFNDTITSSVPGLRPPLNIDPEMERAFQTCRMAKEEWGGRIDGIVRTEGDFEIILCEFERNLEVVKIIQTRADGGVGEDHGGPWDPKGPNGGKGHRPGGGPLGPIRGDYCSLATRYDQFLGQKVHLDFDHFVTAFGYGLDLFPGGSDRPVLDHIPTGLLEPIRRDINAMVNTLEPPVGAFDWQAVADLIVFRYSDELLTYAAGEFKSVESLRDRIEGVLEIFIDYSEFGAKEEIVKLCQGEFIPSSAPVESVGGRAVSSISKKVCSTLASGLLDGKDLKDTVESFKQLVEYLAWTTWEGE
ncbi:hypothetical protein N7478_012130 [Penicillium angulare]|uniref:uncharacterized protein n=1 Tax=Penicillium angulare TaxID=116970 RepID=UPI0025423B45|nr:uncharacterized protein N7478_012130 [Penicillium angulare]KAJ5260525.1 hypothetical protein N7478_012130 [Penicillium angulare]